MRRTEGVVFALNASRKARNSTVLAQLRHALTPTGQDLVRIGLVSDIPDDAIGRRIEHIVQRDREFDRTEIGGQVAAGARDRIDDVITQLIGKRRQLRSGQPAQ